jgi:hypothetical protein
MRRSILIALAGSAASIVATNAPLLKQICAGEADQTPESACAAVALGRWLGSTAADALFGDEALAETYCDVYGGEITVFEIAPEFASNQGPVEATISGRCFEGSPTVALVLDASNEIPGTNVNLSSEFELTATFDLTGATAGKWDVVVDTATLEDAFSVESGDLAILDIAPTRGGDTGTVTMRIDTHFLPASADPTNTTATLSQAGQSDIVGTVLEVTHAPTLGTAPDSLLAIFDLTGKANGAWALEISAPDGQEDTAADLFSIEPAQEAQVTIDIVGSARILHNRSSYHYVRLHNRSNQDTAGTAIISLPPDIVEWYIEDPLPSRFRDEAILERVATTDEGSRLLLLLPEVLIPALETVSFRMIVTFPTLGKQSITAVWEQ